MGRESEIAGAEGAHDFGRIKQTQVLEWEEGQAEDAGASVGEGKGESDGAGESEGGAAGEPSRMWAAIQARKFEEMVADVLRADGSLFDDWEKERLSEWCMRISCSDLRRL